MVADVDVDVLLNGVVVGLLLSVVAICKRDEVCSLLLVCFWIDDEKTAFEANNVNDVFVIGDDALEAGVVSLFLFFFSFSFEFNVSDFGFLAFESFSILFEFAAAGDEDD